MAKPLYETGAVGYSLWLMDSESGDGCGGRSKVVALAGRLQDGAWRLTQVWVVLVVVLLLLMRWVGESSPLLATLLYLPWQVWLALLVPGMLLQVGRWWRMLILAVFTSAVAVFWFGYRPVVAAATEHMAAATEPMATATEHRSELVLLIHNGGDTGFAGLKDLAADYEPDVILLQETRMYAGHLRLLFKEYEFYMEDGFVLLSKLPVVEAKTLYLERGDRGYPSASRFVVEFGGRQVALYNVHLQSPRDPLTVATHNPLITLFDRQAAREHTKFWHGFRLMLDDLRQRIDADPLPVVVAGDFNMVPHGMCYRKFAGGLSDAHVQVGAGFGHTFPRDSHGALRYLQPWLRIDYLFTGQDVGCRWLHVINNGSPRQHLPLVAGLEIK